MIIINENNEVPCDGAIIYNIFIRHVFVRQFREHLNEKSLFADFTSAR